MRQINRLPANNTYSKYGIYTIRYRGVTPEHKTLYNHTKIGDTFFSEPLHKVGTYEWMVAKKYKRIAEGKDKIDCYVVVDKYLSGKFFIPNNIDMNLFRNYGKIVYAMPIIVCRKLLRSGKLSKEIFVIDHKALWTDNYYNNLERCMSSFKAELDNRIRNATERINILNTPTRLKNLFNQEQMNDLLESLEYLRSIKNKYFARNISKIYKKKKL